MLTVSTASCWRGKENEVTHRMQAPIGLQISEAFGRRDAGGDLFGALLRLAAAAGGKDLGILAHAGQKPAHRRKLLRGFAWPGFEG